MKKRLLSDVIWFSILTFNIYYVYWIADTQRDIFEKTKRGLPAGVTLLITFIAWPYHFYWLYRLGKELHTLGAKSDNSVRYLLQSVIPWGICIFSCLISIGYSIIKSWDSSNAPVEFMAVISILAGLTGAVFTYINMASAQCQINEIVAASSAQEHTLTDADPEE